VRKRESVDNDQAHFGQHSTFSNLRRCPGQTKQKPRRVTALPGLLDERVIWGAAFVRPINASKMFSAPNPSRCLKDSLFAFRRRMLMFCALSAGHPLAPPTITLPECLATVWASRQCVLWVKISRAAKLPDLLRRS